MPHRRQGSGETVRQAVDGGLAELTADPARPGAWTLLVDGTPQSHVDLGDPRHLEFEYVRRIGHLIDLAAPPGQPLRVLHLGAGGLTLARYVAATRPGSRQLAVEVDAALVEFVRRWLPLHQRGRGAAGGRGAGGLGPGGRGAGGRGAGRLRIQAGDARAALERVPAGSWDVVISDVFAGARTPAHLTSAEFAAAAAAALAPGGLYVTNVGDGPPLAHARAQVATVRTAFQDVCLIADAAVLRGRRFGNLVVAGAQDGLPAGALARRVAADPFPGRLLHGSGLAEFTSAARPVTDATAVPSSAPPAGVFAARRRDQAARPAGAV